MYITSFVHRDELFDITERWLCGRLEPGDGQRITEILICDGYVLGETLESLTSTLLGLIGVNEFRKRPIRFKGELRSSIARSYPHPEARVNELIHLYQNNPEYFFLEAPINGTLCLNQEDKLQGVYRAKRPRRIAEKANRYVASWIFKMVQSRAQEMAKERAARFGIPLEWLVTPQYEMELEFVASEKAIAQRFKEGTIHLDKNTLRINDVGGIKIIGTEEQIALLEREINQRPDIKVIQKERFVGNYRATSYIVEVPWNKTELSRRFVEQKGWKKYLNRGLSEEVLQQGLEPMMHDTQPNLSIELIFATFPDMVESELGKSIHEERIFDQRENKIYKGYIPLNVEFILTYLFAVGMSAQTSVDKLPIKLWGRYLPDNLTSHIGELYSVSMIEHLT